MGRFSASGARLHEPRQPKPANAAFRQGQPPRSRDFSLGLEHPQRAIPPACREEPAFGRYRTASRAPSAAGAGAASASPNSPRRPRGVLPASSPFRTPPATCPLKRRGAVARDAPLRAAPPPGHIGGQAEQGGLASAADRGNPGKSPQRRKAPQKLLPERRTRVGKSRRACRTLAALSIAARGRTCPKGPENGLGTGSCADASAPSAIAAPDAPQERRRGCTRTPRRRRRSGWTRP